ncbi:MAG TPA: porphobilinogen synthase, partial [Opitutaceae bacterium]|nr:porphobilinogen synthase [Opitutaceae bacterium]
MPNSFKLNLVQRPRRLRRTAALRALVEDAVLRPSDLVAPLFVVDGKGRPEPVASMPGVLRLPVPDLVRECRAIAKLGILAVALFPKLDLRLKDEDGGAALREDALILRAVRAVKKALPDLV